MHAKNVLLAFDGSASSKSAALYAFKIARALGRGINCITVVGTPPGLRKMNPALVALYFSGAEKQARKYMQEVEKLGSQEKITLKCEIVIGAASVPAAIIDYAKNCDADFIVIGAKGTGPKKFLLGSVANAVVSHADCPVLLVR